jgi:hypothetical protein
MLSSYECTICGHGFEVGDDRAGSMVRCPHCGTSNRIPWNHGVPLPATLPPPERPKKTRKPADEGPLPVPPGDQDEQKAEGRRKKTFRILLFGATALFAFLCIPCGLAGWWFFSPGSLGSEQKYFPNKTQLVVSIHVEKGMNSDLFKQLRKDVGKNDGLADLLEDRTSEEAVGLPLADMERITFAGSTTDSEEEAVIVRCRRSVKAADIKSRLHGGRYEEVSVGKFTVYQAQGDGRNSFCVVEDKVAVFAPFGTLQGILLRGKVPELPEAMQSALAKADFSRTVALAANVKGIRKSAESDRNTGPSPLRGLATMLALAPLLTKDGSDDEVERLEKKLATIEYLSGTIEVKSDASASFTAVCTDSTSAEDLKKVLEENLDRNRNKSKQDGFLGDDPGTEVVKEILTSARISASGKSVTVTATLKDETILKDYQKSVSSKEEKPKIEKAMIDMSVIAEQARFFKVINGEFPPDVNTLTGLQPNGGAPLLPREKSIDPWGKPYQLKVEKEDVVVFTTTPKGKEISSAGKK